MFDNSPLVKTAKQVLPNPVSFSSRLSEMVSSRCADVQKNDLEKLIGMLYTPNSEGVIDTELQILMSDKVDPRINEYVRRNLMSLQHALPANQNIPDDDLVTLQPTQYDTFESYSDRVRGYYDSLRSNKDEK